MYAVSAHSNYVHVVVTVVPESGNQNYRVADGVKRVRDQFKANTTRVPRQSENPIQNEKVWTKDGDIRFIDTDDNLEQVVIYILEVQNQMERGK
ncbi:MAG: hypothetical protein AAGA30_04865 [Planctomycetota bacterium]